MMQLYFLVSAYVDDLTSRLADSEEGQTAVEYALILALVAIVLALALKVGLSGALANVITKITNTLNSA